jgi:hypothetical protein
LYNLTMGKKAIFKFALLIVVATVALSGTLVPNLTMAFSLSQNADYAEATASANFKPLAKISVNTSEKVSASSPGVKMAAPLLTTSASCEYAPPKKPLYAGKFIAIRKPGVIAPNEIFKTTVYIQNTGNVPWFSVESGCAGPIAKLGTANDRDRESPFYTNSLLWKSYWESPSRVKMTTQRVDPGQLAAFIFWSKAPPKDGLYREYYDVVLEGITWLNGALFFTDIKVGEPNVEPAKRDLLKYITKSVNLAELDLSGEKSIEVDISEQKMWLKIGNLIIREFPVSTGARKHPTPVGTTRILEKREVRVAGSVPHYIMPKWMMYRKGGYGIHALPSLANDHGVYWREALNHIGQPRSHGCIRLLPADAEFAYEFGEVGMKVVIHR